MKIKAPLTIVIFGATGELYKNKLSSALYNLFTDGFLPKDFSVVGFGRKPFTDSEFRKFTKKAIIKSKNLNRKKLTDFLKHFKYIQGDLNNFSGFKNLEKELNNKIFYLAVPPSLYAPIFKNMHKANLATSGRGAWARILIEKPFGRDLKEAKNLDKMLKKFFDKKQIFRIDHYLAKKAMQDILPFRFDGRALESHWNNRNIERVRIVFHEANVKEDNIASRAQYYDKVGALRDVGQSHVLEMLALVAMEDPKGTSAEKIQYSRGKVLESVSLFSKKSGLGKDILTRGQYKGYLKEPGVKKGSKTETFFRAILGINNKRWRGIPFEVEAGKALNKEEMSMEICFKDINAKLKFSVSEGESTNAHKKVFHDAIIGDKTFFTDTKEIFAEWQTVTDIIKKWQKAPLVIYKKGSKGEDIGEN
jgi:glucose-6-phosphate 1-dehydrogenase